MACIHIVKCIPVIIVELLEDIWNQISYLKFCHPWNECKIELDFDMVVSSEGGYVRYQQISSGNTANVLYFKKPQLDIDHTLFHFTTANIIMFNDRGIPQAFFAWNVLSIVAMLLTWSLVTLYDHLPEADVMMKIIRLGVWHLPYSFRDVQGL